MENEKRLIDANALSDSKWWESLTDDFDKARARIIVMSAPTVDAVEVVHGRWDLQRYYGGVRKGMIARVICSECGYPNEKTNYCPNCGAKMDGGNDDG